MFGLFLAKISPLSKCPTPLHNGELSTKGNHHTETKLTVSASAQPTHPLQKYFEKLNYV